jgi:hypothetical protein
MILEIPKCQESLDSSHKSLWKKKSAASLKMAYSIGWLELFQNFNLSHAIYEALL